MCSVTGVGQITTSRVCGTSRSGPDRQACSWMKVRPGTKIVYGLQTSPLCGPVLVALLHQRWNCQPVVGDVCAMHVASCYIVRFVLLRLCPVTQQSRNSCSSSCTRGQRVPSTEQASSHTEYTCSSQILDSRHHDASRYRGRQMLLSWQDR